MKAPSVAVAVVLGVVAVTLTGCGGGGGGTTTPGPSPAPTPGPTPPTPAPTPVPTEDCLCVFDVDRTLTATQGAAARCPNAKEFPGVHDGAYDQGTLILSQVALLLNQSFCGNCYHGIVSAGEASGDGSKERDILLEYIGGKAKTMTDQWQDANHDAVGSIPVHSSMVLTFPDTQKQIAVDSIVQWFKSAHKITIPSDRVHFFDDRIINIVPFTAFNAARGTQYNARIWLKRSCGSEIVAVTTVSCVTKMTGSGNHVLPNVHFRKVNGMQKGYMNRAYIKPWHAQAARKKRRSDNRKAKAAKIAPRPTAGLLRPVVHPPTQRYNMKLRLGRGFTLGELKEAKIAPKLARTIGIAVDHRRRNRCTESLQENVSRLKMYKSKLLVFPRGSGKKSVKKGDTPKSELQNVAQNTLKEIIPVPRPALRVKARKITDAEKEKSAYKTLKKARTNKKYLGVKLTKAKAGSKEE